MTMNKQELISAVSKKTGSTKRATAEMIEATLDSITEALAAGNEVSLRGFGTLESKLRKERTAHAPKTGEPIYVPARRAVVFHPGKSLKDAVSGD